jgi:phosphate transport system protein
MIRVQNGFAELKSSLLTMGSLTVQAVDLAVQALIDNNAMTAGQAREIEKKVDQMYLDINEYCLAALAAKLYSREEINYLTSGLKIAMELERTCDYANQIAKLVQRKFSKQNSNILAPLGKLTEKMKQQSVDMLRGALDSFATLDCDRTLQVIAKDSTVDKGNRDLFREMVCIVSVNPWVQETIMDYHVAVRYIERVGDRSTNIAELVHYIVKGEPFNKAAVKKEATQ